MTPDKLRALAGVLQRLVNVSEHRRGRVFERTSFKQSNALLNDLARGIEDGSIDKTEAAEIAAALDGVTIHANDP